MHKLFEINQHVLLKNNLGEILILQQDGGWMLPGGRLEESDKTPESGLLRELQEETGLTDIKIEGVSDTGISPSGKTFLIIYKAKTLGDLKVFISVEHTNYAWVNKNNINDYNFKHDSILQKALDYLNE